MPRVAVLNLLVLLTFVFAITCTGALATVLIITRVHVLPKKRMLKHPDICSNLICPLS